MSAKHTPSPWIVDETTALGAYGVWTDYAVNPGHDGVGYPEQICSLPVMKQKREARDANALLISAAPDLLEACKALQMEAAARGCGLRIADEAIAKAEGRTATTTNPPVSVTMPEWEYLVTSAIDHNPSELTDAFNALGSLGWELVHVSRHLERCVFKRRVVIEVTARLQ